MKAAVYARKSNEDDRSDDNKSVTRQISRAKAYAESKSWAVYEDHIYSDEGISGAEFNNRPGLRKMMAHLAEFDIVIMSELSRLGRDTWRNAVVIDDMRVHGVKVFYYLSDEEEKAETPEQRIMISLKSYATEVERARTGERTRDTLSRKAANGYSAGGKCYGYNLVPVYSTSGEHTHTDFEINKEEADIVRGIFRMYAAGHGYSAIAKSLNADPRYIKEGNTYFNGIRVPTPATKRSKGCWPDSSIRAMLYRQRYIGVLEYGRSKNVTMGGSAKKRIKNITESVIKADRPDLRIIEKSLWDRVQTKLESTRRTYNTKAAVRRSEYLLSGLGQCKLCGGNMVVIGGQCRKHYYYGCSIHINRGRTACSNNHRERLAILEPAVLDAIEKTIMTPNAIQYVINRAERLIKERSECTKTDDSQSEIDQLNAELDRFMTLIATGKTPERILEEIHKREERIKVLKKRKKTADQKLDSIKTRRMLAQGIARFKDLIRSDVPHARQALRELLDDRIVFDPIIREHRKTYKFYGQTRMGALVYDVGTEERT